MAETRTAGRKMFLYGLIVGLVRTIYFVGVALALGLAYLAARDAGVLAANGFERAIEALYFYLAVVVAFSFLGLYVLDAATDASGRLARAVLKIPGRGEMLAEQVEDLSLKIEQLAAELGRLEKDFALLKRRLGDA